MIISELNYIESVNAEVVGGTKSFPFGDIDFDKNFDVDQNISGKVNLSGNQAVTAFENEAFGRNTLVESDVKNVSGPGYSGSSGLLISGSSGGGKK